MSLNREWKQICSELSTPLIDVKAILSDHYPQIPMNVLSQKAIPIEGVAFTRQAVIRRDKMKKTKGNDISISMFHDLLCNAKVNEELLIPLVRLLTKIKDEVIQDETE